MATITAWKEESDGTIVFEPEGITNEEQLNITADAIGMFVYDQ